MTFRTEAEQLSLPGLDTSCWKTSPEFSAQENPGVRISESFWRKRSESLTSDYLCLDLREGGGNLLGPLWEINAPLPGVSSQPNTSTFPSGGGGSSLSAILEDTAPLKYCLSRTSCQGILRRARKRGKALPPLLERRLELQMEVMKALEALTLPDDTRLIILDDCTGADDIDSCLTPWDTQQARIFVSTGAAPTLSGCDGGGGRNPGGYVLILNDQGGSRMNVSEDACGTLRAQMHSHAPILFQSHGQDARYNAQEASPTLATRMGTGGGNAPLVYCIASTAIDRQPHNGGNGLGCQEGLCYTITATDRPAVYSRQRSDGCIESAAIAGQSPWLHKNATERILTQGFIRRLMPIETERLMDFPDNWTNIPNGNRPASDSARYRACGNSIVVACAEYILRATAYFLEGGDAHA